MGVMGESGMVSRRLAGAGGTLLLDGCGETTG